ncbi:MAG: type II secretion system F family protein [Candidatus Taylorbacteria bacterium]|nr:type II secretion system F family protein [Candidatus Taylorbacteria bacterium]
MLFNYQAIDNRGQSSKGSIDAITIDVAISSLQRRGFTISTISPSEEGSFFKKQFTFFGGIKVKDVVMLSRQMATLFQAQVSALRVFRLLSAETDNIMLRTALLEIADDLQGGSSISKALSKHPNAFSEFYVNMVRAGEESGKLDETFGYLADHLERSYEIVSKAKNAMIYPVFVMLVFITVMVLMFVMVIPNLTKMLVESGQEIPIYTEAVIGISNFLVNYGLIFLVVLIVASFFLFRWIQTPRGQITYARFQITVPYVGNLYRKLYLSRIADNMHTMLVSAIPIVKTLEITASVVDSAIYKAILMDAIEGVKSGNPVSDSLGKHPEIPSIMVQMMKVGEETGELGDILETLSRFYAREVSNAVDTLVSLIEPALVVALGLGVGFLLAAILIPIYNISAAQ